MYSMIKYMVINNINRVNTINLVLVDNSKQVEVIYNVMGTVQEAYNLLYAYGKIEESSAVNCCK